jgi:phosphoglucomutase
VSAQAAVGKTVVSSAMIDRVAKRLNRKLIEVPVGFKWFVDEALRRRSPSLVKKARADAEPSRRLGVDHRQGRHCSVLHFAAEITARCGRDPGQLYRDLTRHLGDPVADRIEGPASPEQKKRLAELSPQEIRITEIGGEKINCVLDKAPGNGAPIGGIKVITASGWFAARPSGTEDIYKIYGESFRGADHLRILLAEAQQVVDRVLARLMLRAASRKEDMPKSVDQLCINTLRFLAVDAVQKAQSGHPGMLMGAAPLAYVLWTRFLKHNLSNPQWFNRDRLFYRPDTDRCCFMDCCI